MDIVATRRRPDTEPKGSGTSRDLTHSISGTIITTKSYHKGIMTTIFQVKMKIDAGGEAAT